VILFKFLQGVQVIEKVISIIVIAKFCRIIIWRTINAWANWCFRGTSFIHFI